MLVLYYFCHFGYTQVITFSYPLVRIFSMSVSLSLSLRIIKRLGAQILTKEVEIGVRTRLPSCGRPKSPKPGEVEGPKATDPGSSVGDPSTRGNPTNKTS